MSLLEMMLIMFKIMHIRGKCSSVRKTTRTGSNIDYGRDKKRCPGREDKKTEERSYTSRKSNYGVSYMIIKDI